MRAYEKQVKDKRVYLGNAEFVAVIEYYRDMPARDEDRDVEKPFATLKAAQKFLSKYPRDVWDGYDMLDSKYREVDQHG